MQLNLGSPSIVHPTVEDMLHFPRINTVPNEWNLTSRKVATFSSMPTSVTIPLDLTGQTTDSDVMQDEVDTKETLSLDQRYKGSYPQAPKSASQTQKDTEAETTKIEVETIDEPTPFESQTWLFPMPAATIQEAAYSASNPLSLSLEVSNIRSIFQSMQNKLDEQVESLQNNMGNYSEKKRKKRLKKAQKAADKFWKEILNYSISFVGPYLTEQQAAKLSLRLEKIGKNSAYPPQFRQLVLILSDTAKVDWEKTVKGREVERLKKFYKPIGHGESYWARQYGVEGSVGAAAVAIGAPQGAFAEGKVSLNKFHTIINDDVDLFYDVHGVKLGVGGGGGANIGITGTPIASSGAGTSLGADAHVRGGVFRFYPDYRGYAEWVGNKQGYNRRKFSASSSKLGKWISKHIPFRKYGFHDGLLGNEAGHMKQDHQQAINELPLANDLIKEYLDLPDIEIKIDKPYRRKGIYARFYGFGGNLLGKSKVEAALGTKRFGIRANAGVSNKATYDFLDLYLYPETPFTVVSEHSPHKLRDIPKRLTAPLRRFLGAEEQMLFIEGTEDDPRGEPEGKLTWKQRYKKWRQGSQVPLIRHQDSDEFHFNQQGVEGHSLYKNKESMRFNKHEINSGAFRADPHETLAFLSHLKQLTLDYQTTVRAYDYQKQAGDFQDPDLLKELRQKKHQMENDLNSVGRTEFYTVAAVCEAFCENIIKPKGKFNSEFTGMEEDINSLFKDSKAQIYEPWVNHSQKKLKTLTHFRDRVWLNYSTKTFQSKINIGPGFVTATITQFRNRHANVGRNGNFIDIILEGGADIGLQEHIVGAKILNGINAALEAQGIEPLAVTGDLFVDGGLSFSKDKMWRFNEPYNTRHPNYPGLRGYRLQTIRERTTKYVDLSLNTGKWGTGIYGGAKIGGSSKWVQCDSERLGTDCLNYTAMMCFQFMAGNGGKIDPVWWGKWYDDRRDDYRTIFSKWGDPNHPLNKEFNYIMEVALLALARKQGDQKKIEQLLELQDHINTAMSTFRNDPNVENEQLCFGLMNKYLAERFPFWKDATFGKTLFQKYGTPNIHTNNLGTRIKRFLGFNRQ